MQNMNTNTTDSYSGLLSETYISDEFAPIYARHLNFCTEVGLVQQCREMITALSRPHLLQLDGVEPAVKAAQSWLSEAEIYEAKHGLGSKLNRDHPRFVKAKLGLSKYRREGNAEKSKHSAQTIVQR